MAAGKLKEATKLLPRTFREVYAQPKIREQEKAIGNAPVKAMIEFQLANLAALMVTGGNLNDTMTDFISSQLIELYPTESIADIRLCLERGAMGRYGEIQRMDGVTIGLWMQQYLEEKYEELEKNIERKRAEISGEQKKPVDGLEEFYNKMRDQSKISWEQKEFIKKDTRLQLHRKYGNNEHARSHFHACTDPSTCAKKVLVETSMGNVCNSCGYLFKRDADYLKSTGQQP